MTELKKKMTELKPCPFCGGTNLNTSHINEIWCKSCDAGVYLGDHGDNTSQFAIDSWNRRYHWTDKHIIKKDGEYIAYDEAGLEHGKYDSKEEAQLYLMLYAFYNLGMADE